MEIKILEYQIFKGNKVRVQSHNCRNGKWKVNPDYEWHKKIASGVTMVMHTILWKKETRRNVNGM